MTAPADHSLNLDQRQRDMLAAMGVTYGQRPLPTRRRTRRRHHTISHTAAVTPHATGCQPGPPVRPLPLQCPSGFKKL
jgi:hypothetical protein